MATKKQRRRREKLQRHEYEYVIETDDGEEVPAASAREARKTAAASGPPKLVDRRGRVVQPPTWGRVLKRAAIFGPILAILVFATSSGQSSTVRIVNVLALLAIFIPISYLTDVLLYRSLLRRHQRDRRT